MEWKKVKFMQDRVGEDFDGLIISVTKYGMFVELTDMFIEGLVPLATLTDDRYTYHENTREIIGQRNRKIYRLGQKVRVLVDRIDPVEKKIQFALLRGAQKKKQKRLTARLKPPPRFVEALWCRISKSTPFDASGSNQCRDVAQPGRALAWGARGRQFKSARPDQ